MSMTEAKDLLAAYWRWPGYPDGDDPAILRAVADFLDGLDDALAQPDRGMQEDLRRIADNIEGLKWE